MNSKIMSRWALIFLLLAVVGIVFELITGITRDWVWFFIVISTIYSVSSSIKKDLEKIIKVKTTQ